MKVYNKIFKVENTFFLSDLHLFHEKFLQFDSTKQYLGDGIITAEEYYEMVKKCMKDTVESYKGDDLSINIIILGDFAMHYSENVFEVLRRSYPHRYVDFMLIRGNHDNLYPKLKKKDRGSQSSYIKNGRWDFSSLFSLGVYDIADLTMEDKDGNRYFVTATHFPLMSWEKQKYGSIQLYGHMHGTEPVLSLPNMYDTYWLAQGKVGRTLDYYLNKK